MARLNDEDTDDCLMVLAGAKARIQRAIDIVRESADGTASDGMASVKRIREEDEATLDQLIAKKLKQIADRNKDEKVQQKLCHMTSEQLKIVETLTQIGYLRSSFSAFAEHYIKLEERNLPKFKSVSTYICELEEELAAQLAKKR